MTMRIGVLPGDGIGPEVTVVAVDLLTACSERHGLGLEFRTGLLGGSAIEATGAPLPEETLELCAESDALLVGAVGGPAWDSLPAEQNPGLGGLLRLRRELGLFANLRPAVTPPLSSGRRAALDRAPEVDVLLVREATGGAYFSPERGRDGDRAWDTIEYGAHEVRRIVRVAARLAQTRSGRLASVDKANVLESSRLWREVAIETLAEFPDLEIRHLYVDNVAMQLVLRPGDFDVVVTENLFGDILSDELAGLVGSLGFLPSASLRGDRFGLYEPVHGSAPQLAGTGRANPVAAIRSAAMLLRYSAGRADAADELDAAVDETLRAGVLTTDLTSAGAVSTSAFADAVRARLPR